MRTTIFFAVIGLLACPPAASARDFAISVCGTGHVVAQREYDPLSADDALGLAHVELGMELEEVLEGLSLEIAWESGRHIGDLFPGGNPWLDADLLMHGVVLSAAYRLPVAEWMNAVGRVGGTLDFAKLELRDGEQTLLSDWANAKLGAQAVIGVEFFTPRNLLRKWFKQDSGDPGEGFTVGLRLEVGWSYKQEFVYDEMNEPAPGDKEVAKRQIDRAPINLGGINLDGFIFRAGLVVFF
ncbi:hypothetical protein ACFL2F_00665 [Myxococcota bacterium]